MPHPFSTHKNAGIVIITGQCYTARLKHGGQRNFTAQVSLRTGSHPRLTYSMSGVTFRRAYFTLIRLMQNAECGEVIKEVVKECWRTERDNLITKRDNVIYIGDDWPQIDPENVRTAYTKKASSVTSMLG